MVVIKLVEVAIITATAIRNITIDAVLLVMVSVNGTVISYIIASKTKGLVPAIVMVCIMISVEGPTFWMDNTRKSMLLG